MDMTRKTLIAKDLPVILLRFIAYDKYHVMMESNRKVQVSQHCIIEKDRFSMKKSAKTTIVNKPRKINALAIDLKRLKYSLKKYTRK